MKKIILGLCALVLVAFTATSVFSASSIVQSISYSPPMKGFIAIFKGDSSKVIEEKPKQYLVGNTYNGISLTITSGCAGWTVKRGALLPYRTVDGAWRIRFNVMATVSSTSSCTVTWTGITFKSGSGLYQTFSAMANGAPPYTATGDASPGSATTGLYSAASTTDFRMSGDLELDSKPTWAD